MDSEFTKKDLLKIKKYEKALGELIDGSQKYFSITKLTSIKTLCKSELILKDYSVFLANIVLKVPGKLPVKISKKKIKASIANSPYPAIDQGLKEILYKLASFQNQTRRCGWNTLRIIDDQNVLILEYIIRALTSPFEASKNYVYYATRNYVEEYNPRCGTGLIVDSVPNFKKIVSYWKKQTSHLHL